MLILNIHGKSRSTPLTSCLFLPTVHDNSFKEFVTRKKNECLHYCPVSCQNRYFAKRKKINGITFCHNPFQGSHSSWKTWKNDNSFSSPGEVLKFYNFIKNPGKMGVNLEK